MKESAPFWSMRGRHYYNHQEKVPGPGSYSPTNHVLSSSPKYRLGTSQRGPLSTEMATPGPGTYSPRASIGTPAWTLLGRGSKEGFSKSLDIPGPGTYRTPISQDSPRYSVGKGQRESLDLDKKVPGPGTYNPELQSFRGNNLFSRAERYVNIGKTFVPGPGVYEIKTKKEGPSFSFRPKFETKAKSIVPGPGNYEPKIALTSEKSPAWVVGKSQKHMSVVSKDLEYSPGPGTYSKPSMLSGPSWRFGNSTRISRSVPRAPGPGTYEILPTIGNSPPYARINN